MGLWEGRVNRVNTRQPLPAAERRCVPAAALPPVSSAAPRGCTASHGRSLGFLSSFWAHLSRAAGTRAQSLGSPINPCPACGRSLETLESPPPALKLSEEGHLGGALCLPDAAVGAPCEPGMGKGVSHSTSVSPRSRGVRGPPEPCVSPGAQRTTRPSSKQRRLWFGKDAPAVLGSGWLAPGAVVLEAPRKPPGLVGRRRAPAAAVPTAAPGKA